VEDLHAAMLSGVWKVLTKIPLGEKREEAEPLGRGPPGNLDTCVISAPATYDSSKALHTSLLGRRYLSTHHHFHNPLTWSKHQLLCWLLTPAAHLRISDSRDWEG